MSAFPNIVSVAEFFRAKPAASAVFRAIQQNQTISGWALAKQTQADPDELEGTLADLKAQGLIQSDGPGLDGFFYMTSLGYQYLSLAVA
jgi:hypothetical protein